MKPSNKVLLIDDRIGDIRWLVDDLEDRGYEVDQITNERDAMLKLAEVRKRLNEKEDFYYLVIIDVMVPIVDIMDLVELGDDFYEDSARTGIRLCKYIREDLRMSEAELPIVCLSSRSDEEEVRKELLDLGICHVFSRIPQSEKENIRVYIGNKLPRISK